MLKKTLLILVAGMALAYAPLALESGNWASRLPSQDDEQYENDNEDQVPEADIQAPEEDKVCRICQDDEDPVTPENVSHVPIQCDQEDWFHDTCLRAWLQTGETCPLCRAEVGDAALVQVRRQMRVFSITRLSTLLELSADQLPFVEHLHLANNNLGQAEAQALAHALSNMRNLQYLHLANNNLGTEGAQALTHALSNMRNLQYLHLGNNNLGQAGAQALTHALSTMPNLEKLYLTNNNLGQAGAQALAHALSTMHNLEELHLGNNNLGEAGVRALADALRTMSNLQKLDLEDNNLSESQKDDFFRIIGAVAPNCDVLF